jgi:hypothetical protein
MRGTERPAVVRGWHRSRWRPELACAEHAPGLARALPLGRRPAPAPAPPWAGSARHAGGGIAGVALPPPLPAAPAPAGPPLCRTCLLRGLTTPAVARGWHRSRWRIEGACADHASGLGRPIALPGAGALSAAAAPAAAAVAPAAERGAARTRPRRRLAAGVGALALAGSGALVWAAIAERGAPAARAPGVSGAALAPAAGPASAPRAPRLIGWPLSRARNALGGIRLVVGGRRTAAAPAGVVLAQRPAPGTPMPSGSALVVTIARPLAAPRPAPAPLAVSASASSSLPAVTAAAFRPAAVDPCSRGAGWGSGWGAYRC